MLKLVGNAPVVVNETACPTAGVAVAHPIFAEPLVKVTVLEPPTVASAQTSPILPLPHAGGVPDAFEVNCCVV